LNSRLLGNSSLPTNMRISQQETTICQRARVAGRFGERLYGLRRDSRRHRFGSVGRHSSGWRTVLTGMVWILIMYCPTSVRAGGLRDLQDGWLVPMTATVQMLGVPGGDITSDGEGRGLWVACGQSRLYGMPELPLRRLACGVMYPRFALSGSWQRLGDEIYREDTIRGRLVVGRRWHWMLEGGYDRIDLAREYRQSVPRLQLSLSLPLTDRIRFAWTTRLPIGSDPFAKRELSRWLELHGRGQQLCWCLALDRSGARVPVLQLAVLARVASGIGGGMRAEPATGSIGGSTVWMWGKGSTGSWLVRTSHVLHPDLGLTHRWYFAWGRVDAAW